MAMVVIALQQLSAIDTKVLFSNLSSILRDPPHLLSGRLLIAR